MRIFVSYTLRDGVLSLPLLAGLESLLSKTGTPYIDILHNSSQHPQEYVMQMLNEASIFCACMTPGFLQSEWVRLECATAYNLGLPIIELDCGSLVNGDNLEVPLLNNEVSATLNRMKNCPPENGATCSTGSAVIPMNLALNQQQRDWAQQVHAEEIVRRLGL